MNADVAGIFYDTTSLHREVGEEDERVRRKQGRECPPLRERGRSSEEVNALGISTGDPGTKILAHDEVLPVHA